uniref:hypothetical protein n=1 Tax=Herbidospora sakaeratensis TaxID=564415 RepID=UPI000781DDC7|nr:hypothetical protein [Herbidospora sakaeratensis]
MKAVAVGAALLPVAALLGRFMSETGIGDAICSGGLECILPLVGTAYAVATALAWVALALLGVRPAGRVALGGSAATAVLFLTITGVTPQSSFVVYVVAAALCFAFAAWLSGRFRRQPQE